MCRRTNGKEHAYYCHEDGHFYLKDDGSAYSQVFVEDNGKAAADAAKAAKVCPEGCKNAINKVTEENKKIHGEV